MIDLLAAFQQADSAFPSGAVAFSHGLEGLASLAPLDRQRLADVVSAVISHRWAPCDRVALIRAYRAGGDLEALAAIDAEVEAATLCEPLRVGSKRHGAALLAAHVRLATPGAAALRSSIDAGQALGHLPVVQGFVWRVLGLSQARAVAVSGYATAAGLVAAAVRLGAVGAIDGQAVLASALAVVADAALEPVAPDAVIASFTPWIDIAAARHARAPLRLFVN